MGTDTHEMRRINGRVVAVYTDSEGHQYRIVDGNRRYIGGYLANDERGDYCQACCGNHEPGECPLPD